MAIWGTQEKKKLKLYILLGQIARIGIPNGCFTRSYNKHEFDKLLRLNSTTERLMEP